MKVAAIIIGLLVSIVGFGAGALSDMFLSLFGASKVETPPALQALFYGPPVVMLGGTLATLRWPLVGGVLMLIAALAWLAMSFNVLMIGPAAAALAGLLALFSRSKARADAAARP